MFLKKEMQERKRLVNPKDRGRSVLDAYWAKVMESGGSVSQIVRKRLSLSSNHTSPQSVPTQIIGDQKEHKTTLKPLTEKIETNLEPAIKQLDALNVLKESPKQQSVVSSETVKDARQDNQNVQISVQSFPKCFDISQYSPMEQLIILELRQRPLRKISRENLSQSYPKPENIIESIMQEEKGIYLQKQDILNEIKKNEFYKIQECNCGNHHLILLFYGFDVPSFSHKIEIVKKLVSEDKQYNSSSRYLIHKIIQMGYRWKYMKQEITKILKHRKGKQIIFSQIFKSYKDGTCVSSKQNHKIHLSQCFDDKQYSEEESDMLVYLKSSMITVQDKTRTIPSVVKLSETLNEQDLNIIVKKISNNIARLSRRYTLRHCDCEQKHQILYYSGRIVPTFHQKEEMVKQIYNNSKRMNMNYFASYIKMYITRSGYQWKHMYPNIKGKIIQLEKSNVKKATQSNYSEVSDVSGVSESEQQYSQSDNDLKSQSQTEQLEQQLEQQKGITIGNFKDPQQSLELKRECILKNVRRSKRIVERRSKQHQRAEFIKRHTE